MSTAHLELGRESEEDLVVRWRTEELERAGYDSTLALIIARLPRIDLHLALDLLRRGCPQRTALRILL